MKLYSYFRSSAAYRVRIALNLKGLHYELVPVHLLKNGGEQRSEAYCRMNPTALVPTLTDGDFNLGQSMSILEYLEETHPETPLLPKDAHSRARIRAFCQSIACDIHPVNNLRLLQYLSQTLQIGETAKSEWYAHWVTEGFKALEALLHDSNGSYCFNDTPTLADCCLIPQVYNAKRFNIDLTAFPKIESIYTHCSTLSAFQNAAPEAQSDAA